MKKKLLLTEVLRIKADVEERIERLFYDIVSYNMTDTDIAVYMLQLEKLEDFLIVLKLAIQEANLSKLDGVMNYFTIFKVSNLKAKLRLYYRIEKALKRATLKKSGLAQITLEEVTSKIASITGEIALFEERLTRFNNKKKLTISIDESLEYLL